MEGRLGSLARTARINWPATAEVSQFAKHAPKATKAFANCPVANAWLANPRLLKTCRQVTALQMRTNTCADRVSLSRANEREDVRCRKCQVQLETLGHILGQCVHTKKERIKRHNDIRDYVTDRVVARSGAWARRGAILKPDLVVKNQEGVFVVDFTVRHEDGVSLALSHKAKIAKYNVFLPQLAQAYGAPAGSVLPIVVGTRGALPSSTERSLAVLGVRSRKDLLTISLMAHRASIEIYHHVMDYNAPQA